MPDLQLLSLLLGYSFTGFWFFLACHLTRYFLAANHGYTLLFLTSLPGLLLYAFASTLTAWAFAPVLSWWIGVTDFSGSPDISEFLFYLILSLLLGVLLGLVINVVINPDRAWRIVVNIGGNLKQDLVRQALADERFLEFTLANGKSYVGMVMNVQYGLGDESQIDLWPVWSGYRDSETKQLHFTENYIEVLSRRNHDADFPPLGVVFNLSDVLTLRPFNLSLYKLFHNESMGTPT